MADNHGVENGVNGSCSSEEESLPDSQTVSTHEEELDPPKEEERTLTDHLNKKLLESFFTRLQEGSIAMPQSATEDDNNEENSFDNDK